MTAIHVTLFLMIIIIWGVTGSGKTTISRALGNSLRCPVFDADNFHPEKNIRKMRAGMPLNDEDRYPWLQRLRVLVDSYTDEDVAVLACSALKASYRKMLGFGQPHVRSFLLFGSDTLIAERLARRDNHFMPSSLLPSQMQLLELEHGGLTLNAERTPEQLVSQILRKLSI